MELWNTQRAQGTTLKSYLFAGLPSCALSIALKEALFMIRKPDWYVWIQNFYGSLLLIYEQDSPARHIPLNTLGSIHFPPEGRSPSVLRLDPQLPILRAWEFLLPNWHTSIAKRHISRKHSAVARRSRGWFCAVRRRLSPIPGLWPSLAIPRA